MHVSHISFLKVGNGFSVSSVMWMIRKVELAMGRSLVRTGMHGFGIIKRYVSKDALRTVGHYID